MESIDPSIDIETRRMELRGVIRLAGEVIAQYWPMRTFVHHNPLHSLEYLPFEETVRRGKQFLGGNGYLPSHLYRGYLRSGRIQPRHLDTALTALVRDQHVTIGSRQVSHGEVLRACMAEGLCTPIEEPLDVQEGDHDPHQQLVESLAERLAPVLFFRDVDERIRMFAQGDLAALGQQVTLSSWCDRTLGTHIGGLINGELIKWCEAFLDEGHATWPMPERQQAYTMPGKLWRRNGRPAASRTAGGRLPPYRSIPKTPCLTVSKRWRFQRSSGRTTWRSNLRPSPAGPASSNGARRKDYVWQQAYPVGLVKFLAVRLWYVRELVQKVCREELGIEELRAVLLTWTAVPRVFHAQGMGRRQTAGRLCRTGRASPRNQTTAQGHPHPRMGEFTHHYQTDVVSARNGPLAYGSNGC